MYKIYSRPRIKIPKFNPPRVRNIKNKKSNISIKIIVIIIIAVFTVRIIYKSIYPIYDQLCESKAKSIATISSNSQSTSVMKDYKYEDLFTIEKDDNNYITMIKANMLTINEIVSKTSIKIQEDIDSRGRENIEIALR